MDAWLHENLACPRTGEPLTRSGDVLRSPAGAEYPVVEGVPVLLRDDVPQTIGLAHASLTAACDAQAGRRPDDWFLSTVGVSDEERALAQRLRAEKGAVVDPVVAVLISATNGILYRDLIGKVAEFPMPELRLPPGEGRRLLDIGCSWGRWSVAAARKGYRPVGLDPSLGAVLAAKRMCARLGVAADFVVGDARFLPFRRGAFDNVFSYSVVQHFSKADARQTLGEVARVLRTGGECFIQMPNALGVRSFYHQLRRGFRDGRDFEVRYWWPGELVEAFQAAVGPAELSVDCYFGLGLQAADAPLMGPGRRRLIALSEWLRRRAESCAPLRQLADSVYLKARRP
jgi:SAM-dependent methyltransferase/uncharacterized protein YbaR (Trm112 family)